MPEHRSLRTSAYWQEAAATLRQPRLLAIAALFLALCIAIFSVFIPLPNNLRIYFTFVPKALCAAICGPIAALVFGFADDLLGFMIHPSGAFFFGYTLSAVMGMLIYALGLFRAKITVWRIAITKLAVNLLVNVGLGALWSSMLYGKAYLFYAGTSLVKNLLLWPAEVIVLTAVFRLLGPAMERAKLIPRQEWPLLNRRERKTGGEL